MDERTCETCKYNNRTWDMEPCDSCTIGGDGNKWEPKVKGESSYIVIEKYKVIYGEEKSMGKLKPCPFCGRNHGLLITSIHHRLDDVTIEQWSVFCDASGDKSGCGASCGYHKSKKEAIEAWNRRAEPWRGEEHETD